MIAATDSTTTVEILTHNTNALLPNTLSHSEVLATISSVKIIKFLSCYLQIKPKIRSFCLIFMTFESVCVLEGDVDGRKKHQNNKPIFGTKTVIKMCHNGR